MADPTTRSPRRSLAGQLDGAVEDRAAAGYAGAIVLRSMVEKYEWDDEDKAAHVVKGRLKGTGVEVIRKYIEYSKTGQGTPYHVIRETTILKGLQHDNIIRLFDVVQELHSVYLIYECLPRDLRTVLDEKCSADYVDGPATCDLQLTHYYRQMLEGVAFLHKRCILHRDLKPNDLRINAHNVIKITNFRLARQFSPPLRTFTHEVVTLWYRPPEILLGKKRYDTSVDMWSAGCLLAEITSGEALFRGDSEIDQLFQIFRALGTPTKAVWPELKTLPDYKATFPQWPAEELRSVVTGPAGERILADTCEDLLNKLLVYDSAHRIKAVDALEHPYFDELRGWTPPATRPAKSTYIGSAMPEPS